MYEFSPKPKRLREKLWMSVCLFFGVLSYSLGSFLPYPMASQLLSVVLLTVAVLITVRYLMRDYIYRLAADEEGNPRELIVTEVMGKRRTVVCRVWTADVVQIRLGKETDKNWRHSLKKQGIYRYVSQMQSENSAFLEILDDGKSYFLEIEADQQLISLLQPQKKQYLSDK